MPPSSAEHAASELPSGYTAIPVVAGQQAGPLRLCAVIRRVPDPAAGYLVLLREMVDAKVFLGCVLDAGGRVRQWVELWVQTIEGISTAVSGLYETITNAALDQRWRRHFESLVNVDSAGILNTGWEAENPPPMFLDLSALAPVHPTDAGSGDIWRLCRDDAVLTAAGLPAYSSSLHRYLHLPSAGAESAFVPVTPEAPTNDRCLPMKEVVGDDQRLVPLNPGGGLMLVRTFSPVGPEAYVDLLGGGSWDGVRHGQNELPFIEVAALRKDPSTEGEGGHGRIFMGAHGRWGRVVETFHLKLRMLADAVGAVRALARHNQRPFLNLSPEAFQVRLGRPGSGLPFFWTARTVLVESGQAILLPIENTDATYYIRAGLAGASIYRPDVASAPVRSRASVRIRQVLPETGDTTIVEGTFATQERVETARNDLVWLRLGLTGGRIDLYAHLKAEAALAPGEWRFRTIGQRLDEQQVAALKSNEGVTMHNTLFEIVPLLSTPCDLYALAVLAVRTLLVDKQTTLPVALDEMLSLARQVALDHDDSAPLGARVRSIFDADKRWVESLGPQRLTQEEITATEAFDLIPADLWWDALGMIVRMFPGIGPDSLCRDFGDARGAGLAKVFDPVMNDLDSLLLRTRSLIVIDWRFNREVHAVIRKYLTGMADDPGRG